MTLVVNLLHGVLTTSYINWLVILGAVYFYTIFSLWAVYGIIGGVLLVCTNHNLPIPGLQNPLSYIHPLIILCFYHWGFVSVVEGSTSYRSYTILSFTALSLVLGGWWAFQEFTWGGWWNWDSVEFPILVLVLSSIYHRFHIFWPRSLNFYQNNNAWSFTLGTALTVCFIRYSSALSVHAFTPLNGHYVIYYGLGACAGNQLMCLLFMLINNPFHAAHFVNPYVLILLLIYSKTLVSVVSNMYFNGPNWLHYILILLTVVIINYNMNLVYTPQMYPYNLLQIHNYTSGGLSWVNPQTINVHSNLYSLNSLIN